MLTIQRFEKIRRDGKVIDETMTAKDMVALGWSPEKVIEVRWLNGSDQVRLNFKYGVLARVVAGGEYVVLIEEMDDKDKDSELWIFNSDGSRRIKISNTQQIKGGSVNGEFGWLEQPRSQSPGVFGVIFGRRSESSAYQLDIDAKSGQVIGVYPTR